MPVRKWLNENVKNQRFVHISFLVDLRNQPFLGMFIQLYYVNMKKNNFDKVSDGIRA
jgi:hypothetical protein